MKCFVLADLTKIKELNDKAERAEISKEAEEKVLKFFLGGYLEIDSSYDDYNGFSHREVRRVTESKIKIEDCVVYGDSLVGYLVGSSVYPVLTLDKEFVYPETWNFVKLYYSPKEVGKVVYGEEDVPKENVVALVVPEDVESPNLGGYPNLIKVWLPSTVKRIEHYFPSDRPLKEVYFAGTPDDWAKIEFKYDTSNPSTIGATVFFNGEIPESIELNVEKINDYAFAEFKSLRKVRLSENVKTISNKAFCCSGLVEINIPDSVIEIGKSAFRGCSSLEQIRLPDDLEIIDEEAFEWTGIKEITFPSRLKKISKSAFSCCKELASIDLPDEIQEIDEFGFYSCAKLKSVNHRGKLLETIGQQAFAYCYSLEDIAFGEGLKYIGQECFTNCQELKNVSLPSTIETLKAYAFNWCPSIISLTIPEKVERLDLEVRFPDLYLHRNIKQIWMESYCTLTIHYDGTVEEWVKINKYIYVKKKGDVINIICSDGERLITYVNK